MKISVKTSKGEVYSIETEGKESMVSQLKEKIEEKLNVPVSKIRLIHVGKLLKNDETLGSYNLEEGSTVHLVVPNSEKKSPTEKTSSQEKDIPTQASSSVSSSMPNIAIPGAGPHSNGPAGNPFGTFDPNMMKGFSDLGNQDGIHAAMQNKMKELMKNPEQMKLLMEASLSMQNIPEPTKKMMMDNINKFAEMAKTNPEQFELFVNQILDNPTMSDLYMGQAMSGMGMGGMGGQYAPANAQSFPTEPSANIPMGMPSFNREEALKKYSSELLELQQIGYSNVELNLVALVCTEGDLTKAVNLIMDWTSEDNH